MMMTPLHLLQTDMAEPERFTYPFCYAPHPLAVLAADEVKRIIGDSPEWLAEAEKGKMFGVLVVRKSHSDEKTAHSNDNSSESDGKNTDSTDGGLYFLAAYSGLFCGRNDWSFFVPPVYDLLNPAGHFKQKEAEITAINHRITALENAPERLELIESISKRKRDAGEEEREFRERMRLAKEERDRRRNAGEGSVDTLVRESQFLKAELRRLKKRNADSIGELEKELEAIDNITGALKTQRRERSEALQTWLFQQFDMLNARGERRNLCSIFADTPQRIPPSGAGECCAPKLLQYAYEHGLHPVCMAEFWWGESPKGEIRHHFHYYPSCRGKCLPILTHMLQGLDVEPNPLDAPTETLYSSAEKAYRAENSCSGKGVKGREEKTENSLRVLYADDDIVVADKPSGMLSVPGRSNQPSVVSILNAGFGDLLPVHRLDMDTSGLLLLARNKAAHKALQRQFLQRTVRKEYHAVVVIPPDGLNVETSGGVIRLPLRPDPLDRPRQVVDTEHGKPAVTEWRVLKSSDDRVLLSLIPHTGRTHQLRVHCAHRDGLGAPILGDRLYGTAADRLYLHAARLEFVHPTTGERMAFHSEAEFKNKMS